MNFCCSKLHIYCCFQKKNEFFCLNGPPASFLGPRAKPAWPAPHARPHLLPHAAPVSRLRAGRDRRVAAVRRRCRPGGTLVALAPLRVRLHRMRARPPPLRSLPFSFHRASSSARSRSRLRHRTPTPSFCHRRAPLSIRPLSIHRGLVSTSLSSRPCSR
jgi:hypothetical protein